MDTTTPLPRNIAEQMKTDADLVLSHVIVDRARDFATRTNSKLRPNAFLAGRVALAPFDNLHDLATVLGWVLYVLDGDAARGRVLTPDEVLVVAAARRLTDIVAVLDDLGRFAESMAAKDAREARRLWDAMRPSHTLLLALRPDLEALDLMLHNLEAEQRPRAAVHH